jgi:hypothetical protein
MDNMQSLMWSGDSANNGGTARTGSVRIYGGGRVEMPLINDQR